MQSSSAKANCLSLAVLLLLGHSVTSLIVPEEIPTLLSVIYSNIPPIKKGTDSRVGVGFRLGEHADFQVLVELGPQKETEPLEKEGDSKKKRAAMLTAAMRGELGPLAQAVAKYQMEQKLKQLIEKYKLSADPTSKQQENSDKTTKSEANAWLSQWSHSLTNPGDSEVEEITRPKVLPNINRMRVVNSPIKSETEKGGESTKNDMTIWKNLFDNSVNETRSA